MSVEMQTEELNSLVTHWTVVRRAHGGAPDAASAARGTLLQRYSRAVYRYLLGAVRDEDVAGELSQEFALRLLRGDFWRADRERGRFRDYIRTVLINLLNKHFRSQQRRPAALDEAATAAAAPAGPAAPTFEECLRDEVLARTWAALKEAHPRYHAVLLMRAEDPALSSNEMAERLTATTGENWKADQVRKTLERARTAFVNLLLEDVSFSLNCSAAEDLWEALEELDLLQYCRAALERRGLGS
jgi:RNA polymerase sigma-70 factor (ECF subfamily)